MDHKFLIIAVSVLLIIGLVFGYSTLQSSFNFVENQLNGIAKIGNSILKISGVDFNTNVYLFVPSYDEVAQGNYIDSSGNMADVRTAIDSLIPQWLRNNQNKDIELLLYPTFYSGNIQASYIDWSKALPSLGFDDLSPVTPTETIYSSDRILRFHVTILTTSSGNLEYEIYVFKENTSNQFCYFVTYKSTDIGYFSKNLNNQTQFTDEKDLDKKLNSAYIEELGKSNFLMIHNYDMISNLQNTDVYVQYSFDEFIK